MNVFRYNMQTYQRDKITLHDAMMEIEQYNRRLYPEQRWNLKLARQLLMTGETITLQHIRLRNRVYEAHI